MPAVTRPPDTEPKKKNDKNENDELQKLLLALLFLLVSFSCILCSSHGALLLINRERIEGSMLSDQRADYSRGPGIAVAPLSENLIDEAAQDEEDLSGQSLIGAGIPIAILPNPIPTPIATPPPILPTPTLLPTPTPTLTPTISSQPTSAAPPTQPPATAPPDTTPTPAPTQPPSTQTPSTQPSPTTAPTDVPTTVPTNAPTNPPPTNPPATSTPTSPTATPTPEPPPSLTINDVSVIEGNSGTVNAVFTVSLSRASSQTISVNYATANGSAIAPGDYTALPLTTLSFPPGVTTQQITVRVNGDTINEPDETFLVNLSNPVNATISDGQGQGTIIDDDAVPGLTIDDVSVTEGDSGTVDAVFTVSLSGASSQTISVNYATANGSAIAPGDYIALPLTLLSFPPGVTTQQITVRVNGDTLNEADETFLVNLSSPVNATISDGQGQGTIIDDDAVPGLTIDDVSVTEGDIGTVDAIFTVSLSAVSGQTINVDYVTADGSATAPSDYTALPLTPLSFPPGVTTQQITVRVNGDTLYENDETFFVNLSNPVNVTISDGQGQGTILNDDLLPPTVDFELSNYQVAENSGPAVITVTLSSVSGLTATVDYTTNPFTGPFSATIGSDYIPTSGTLTFSPGVTSQVFTVTIIDNAGNEPDEVVELDLSNPSGVAGIGPNDPATLTIQDKCRPTGPPPDIGGPDCHWVEVAPGTSITVTLSSPISRDGTPNFDMVYFERESPDPGLVYLDFVIVEVATSTTSTWYPVFYWGDSTLDSNTNIGQAPPPGGPYGPPELNDMPIPMTTPPLHQSSAGGPITGVAIDLDNAPLGAIPPGSYQFVRISVPSFATTPAEVDAIQPFFP